jgi:hypothetical protein
MQNVIWHCELIITGMNNDNEQSAQLYALNGIITTHFK